MRVEGRPEVSVVIPVYNSAAHLSRTVRAVETELGTLDHSHEIILVDDGSRDTSWAEIRKLALDCPGVMGIRFLRNRGQHSALLAGIRASHGSFVVLMDDDGQNPATEIATLLDATTGGFDLVFGAAQDKQHSGFRNLASGLVDRLANHLFDKPPAVRISNFKVLSRGLADRISQYASDRPNINAEALLYCTSVTSVTVQHHARQTGDSQYTLRGLIGVFSRLLLGYSLLPLRAIVGIGLTAGVLGFVVGLVFLVHGLLFGTPYPGWTGVVVIESFMLSAALLGISVVGEYTMRSLERAERRSGYVVIDRA